MNVTKEFTPVVGMVINPEMKNGYTGIIEYVGKDYFILRNGRAKDGEPILIKPFQYNHHTFLEAMETFI